MAVVTLPVYVPSIATWAVGQEERAVGGHPDELRCCRPHFGQYPLEARVWRQAESSIRVQEGEPIFSRSYSFPVVPSSPTVGDSVGVLGLLAVHNTFALPPFDLSEFLAVSFVLMAYSLVSCAILHRFFPMFPGWRLGDVF